MAGSGPNLGTAFVSIMPEAKGIKGTLSKLVGGEADSAGKNAGDSMGKSLVSTLKGIIAAAGIGKFLKDALSAGGDLQQSFGGLETIYEDAAEAAKGFAKEAYQAGISANDYAEQAVSFGAALKQAYGGDTSKAMAAANTAIMDMADNSAKMGTEIGQVQSAYQGFAKQNYTMLDNLKLGYGGTKTEMERLLADAEKLSGVKYNIDNLGDVYDAIHVIQEDLGLTGVAAKEAADTFTGSFGAVKAALTNFMANLTLGEDIGPSLQALLETVGNFLFNNLFPMVGNIISTLPGVIGSILLQGFQAMPGVVESAIAFLNNLTQGITDGSGTLTEKMRELGQAALNMFKNTDWIGLGKAVINLLLTGIKTVAPIIWEGLKTIGTKAWEWFKNVDWKGVGTTAINFVRDGIQSVGSKVWETVKEIGTTAWDWFRNIDWRQVGYDAMDFIINGIKSLASNLWELMKSNAIEGASRFTSIDWRQVGLDVINFIVTGLESLGSFLWGTLQRIGEEAKSWFQGIDWWGVGANIINGIVSGICALGANIANTLMGFAHNAWARVKGFFGIASPSKLMRDSIGKWIPLGVAEGIDEESDSVTTALNNMAKDAVDDFDASIGVNGGLAMPDTEMLMPGRGIAINVYPSEGMDERRLADLVSDRLTLLLQQEEAVWGTA